MELDMSKAANTVIVNPVRLINEVKKRPALYDSTKTFDREEKLALWKEIGAAMYTDWDVISKSVAYDRVLQLQRKWRSLRDAYNRELRARKTGVRINKRVYMYFKAMSFLGGFDEEISDTNEEHDTTDKDPLTTSSSAPAKKRKRKSKRRHSIESDSPGEPEMTTFAEVPREDDDSDRLFLLSFLPEMKQLPVNVKMWVRARVANIMQEAVEAHLNGQFQPSSSSLNVKRQRHDLSD